MTTAMIESPPLTTYSDSATAQGFVETIWPDGVPDGSRIAVCGFDPKPWARLLDSPTAAAATAIERNGRKCVFIGCAAMPAGLPPGKRGESDQAIAIPGFGADIDVKKPGSDKRYPPTEDDALRLIAELPIAPTVVVRTGGGLHAWWLLDEPWVFESEEDRRKAMWLSEAWGRLIQQRASAHGWSLDSTFDLARVLRIAGTANHKYDPPRRVEVLRHDEAKRCSPHEFELDELPLSFDDWQRGYEAKQSSGKLGAVAVSVAEFPDDTVDLVHNALLSEHPKYARYWNRQADDEIRKDQRDQKRTEDVSASVYTFRLGWNLAFHGADDAQVVRAIKAWRQRFNAKTHDATWYARELQKIRTSVEKIKSEQQHGQHYKLTDVGNAERMVDAFGGDLHYCHPQKTWYCWDGKRWARDTQGRPAAIAKRTIRNAYADASKVDDDAVRRKIIAHLVKSESDSRLTAMEKRARSENGIPIETEEFNADHSLLNCPNGTVDLATGEIREHRRGDKITVLCPTEYRRGATAPLWQKFIESIFVDRDGRVDSELICFVQRLLGYAITGETKEEVLPILWGEGANGKTTLLNVLQFVIGKDYAMQAAPGLLVQKRGDSHPTEKADLFGKRLVAAAETGCGNKLNETLVKQLTGREPVRARWMKRDFFEFEPTHTLFLCTNHKPEIDGDDHGIWRRILLIPFRRRFWDADKGESGPLELKCDKSLEDRLKLESQGILNWLIEGCLQWRRGLRVPASVQMETAKYRSDEDKVRRFVDEMCVLEPGGQTQASAIYNEFQNWCTSTGEKAITQRAFGAKLSNLDGLDKKRSNGVWYTGIRLRISADEKLPAE